MLLDERSETVKELRGLLEQRECFENLQTSGEYADLKSRLQTSEGGKTCSTRRMELALVKRLLETP